MNEHDPREERFQKGIQLLVELSEKTIPIIVEGPKDVAALRTLGLKGPIITLAGRSLVALTDELTDSQQLLILFDFDRRGNQLASQLTKSLQGIGVEVLVETRRKLSRAFCWRVRVIEGLKTHYQPSKGAKL
jgi:5S rRNA maturation endonuclease (ribonuclease M5)